MLCGTSLQLLTLRLPCRHLHTLGVAQLRTLFEDVYGQRTQSNNSTWLRRKLSQPRDDTTGAGKRLFAREDELDHTQPSNGSAQPLQNPSEPACPQWASRATVSKSEQQLQDRQSTAAGTGPTPTGAQVTAARWDVEATNGKGPGNLRVTHSYSNTPYSRANPHTDDSDTSARTLMGLQVSLVARTHTPCNNCTHLQSSQGSPYQHSHTAPAQLRQALPMQPCPHHPTATDNAHVLRLC